MANNSTTTPLTVSEKAALFDYLASRLEYANLQLNFGGSDKIYHERKSPEHLAAELRLAMSYEAESDSNS